MTQESMSLKKILTDHNHDKFITSPEFNTLAASVFNSRLAQVNLIIKTDSDTKLSREKLRSINQNNYLLKMS